ncbi:MAG: hypothetical protein ABSE62_13320 [Chthoniobacteraceae bacterium]|jgi:hypothetical protein
MSKIEWEYDLVERPFCEQLKAISWQWIEGDTDVPDFTERANFRELMLKGRLGAALKKLNLRDGQPWLAVEQNCNRVMANEEILQATFVELMQRGEVDVCGQKGGTKRADGIHRRDILRPSASRYLINVPKQAKKKVTVIV